MSDDINDRGLSARHIRMTCDASLKRLGVDYIDLYQMHHIDRSAPMGEIWQAMERLITQGKIIYVGSSNFPGWAIARANEKANARHQLGLVSEQSLYNLIERRAELEVLPAYREYGLGVIPWSPLAGGLLAGPGDATGGRRQSAAALATNKHASQLQRFAQLCEAINETPSATALAGLLHQPGITSTIIGPATAHQLSSVSHVPDIRLDEDTRRQINAIFPPCGQTPEACAG